MSLRVHTSWCWWCVLCRCSKEGAIFYPIFEIYSELWKQFEWCVPPCSPRFSCHAHHLCTAPFSRHGLSWTLLPSACYALCWCGLLSQYILLWNSILYTARYNFMFCVCAKGLLKMHVTPSTSMLSRSAGCAVRADHSERFLSNASPAVFQIPSRQHTLLFGG